MARKKRSWAATKAAHCNTRHDATLVMDTKSAVAARRLATQLEMLSDGPKQLDVAKRVRALEDKAAESAETFVFEGIGRSRYELLVAENPPTEEQNAELPEGQSLAWNPETFPPRLAAASCVEPAEIAGDIEEWTEIHRDWSKGQWAVLWGACMAANAGVVEAPKSPVVSDVLSTFGGS